MKKRPLKSPSATKNWRIGDYIRQLSIVILGIVVTFVGGNIIGDYSKQRELAAVMQLLKSELRDNQDRLLYVKEKIAVESRISDRFIKHGFRYQEIPEDTLLLYMRVINSTLNFKYSDNSMEVLKNSSLIQYITDKDFATSLMQTYELMRDFQETTSIFYSNRSRFWVEIQNDFSDSQLDAINSNNGDYAALSRIVFSSKLFKNYVTSNNRFFSPDAFDNVNDNLEKTIQAIEKRYQ